MPLHLAACRLFLLAAVVTSPAAAAAESHSSSNCTLLDAKFVRAAFLHVAIFPLPSPCRRTCRPVRRLRFPSRDLAGVIGWAELGNLSSLLNVDLSGNSLQGGIDAWFWRAPLLRDVDVSRNNLDGALRFDDPSKRLASVNISSNQFISMEGMDVSGNVIRTAPEGLRNLTEMQRLDFSSNGMSGRFPDDLPPLDGLVSLNMSDNNFSGVVPDDIVRKFGHDAFIQAGNALQVLEQPSSSSGGGKKGKRAVVIALIAVGAVVTTAMSNP